MYLTIFPAAIEIKKRSANDRDESSVARPRYIPPPPPPPPRSPSSTSWEEGSVDNNGPLSWDAPAPVDGLLSYVLTGRDIYLTHHENCKFLSKSLNMTKVENYTILGYATAALQSLIMEFYYRHSEARTDGSGPEGSVVKATHNIIYPKLIAVKILIFNVCSK